MAKERFQEIEHEELLYVLDTYEFPKTIDDFIKEIDEPEDFTQEQLEEIAYEEFMEYAYENSMGSDIVKKLNEFYELSVMHQNTKEVLNDFMNMLNDLQANPTDKSLLGQARDMLMTMGEELKK